MYTDIWTQREWIKATKSYTTTHTVSHAIYFGTEYAYDMCCSIDPATPVGAVISGVAMVSGAESQVGITRTQYIQHCSMNGYASFASRTIRYGKDQANSLMHIAYVLSYNDKEIKEAEVISDLGYGDKEYKDLTQSERLAVYNEMIARDYALVPGRVYTTSLEDNGYIYDSVNTISTGILTQQYVYGDYTVAYSHRDPSDWTQTYASEGKHYVSAFTGTVLAGTYTDIKNYLANVPKLNGGVGSDGGVCKDYINPVGSGFNLIRADLGLSVGTAGIHIYDLDEISDIGGEPIHTLDPETPDPSIPHSPETPTEDKQNTGDAEIVKIYVNMYTDDSGKVHHIEDVGTFYKTGVTSSIIIEDEKYYKVTKWIESPTYNPAYKGTQWLSSTGEANSFDYSVRKQSTATTLLQDKDAGFKLDKDTNTLYLLYIKQMPYIETSDTKVPDTTTDFEPTNPTYPENPSPTPDKQGGYNIIKVYTILDEYNGTPLKSETYTQSSTTPFIKIEQESNWTLAHWKVTNTYKVLFFCLKSDKW